MHHYRICSPARRSSRTLLVLLGLFILLAGPAFTLAGRSLLRVEDTPRAALWRRIYEAIPESWRFGRVLRVREVSDRRMDRLVEECGDESNDGDSVVDGFFQDGAGDENDPDTITLRESLREEEAVFVFTHEYGHAVWDRRLTDDDHDVYLDLWRQQRRQKRLVTAYARESCEEGFAEAFAFYLRKPDLLRRRDPASWRFLRDLEDEFAERERQAP